jgi:hypothetical protein
VTECLCGVVGALEALAIWEARVRPVVRRAIRMGHRLDSRRLSKVSALVVGLETSCPFSLSKDNAHHSHHALWCPARCGGARTEVPNLGKVPSVGRRKA